MKKWYEKNVVLYGESLNCYDFYNKFAHQCNVVGIVCVEAKDECKKLFQKYGVDVYEQKEFENIRYENGILILCPGANKREEHDAYLEKKGYIYGVDYIDSLYAEHSIYQNVRKNMHGKKIWVFGAGNNAKEFYEKHHETVQIEGFISNYKGEKEFLGLPVCRPKEVVARENIYILVCSAVEEDMSAQLREYGLKDGQDFAIGRWLNRKLFVAWGSCQVYSVMDILCQNQYFKQGFDSLLIFDSSLQRCNYANRQRLHTYGQVCDVLFYNSEGLENNNEAIVKRFYSKAKVYNIPFYYFRGQLPQATEDCSRYSLRYENMERHFAFWFIGDAEVERLVAEGKSKEEILKEITSVNYWTKEQILNRWLFECKKVSMLDRLSSLCVSKFLKDNYKEKLIFKDGIHFCGELCVELANQLARLLEIKEIGKEQAEELLRSMPPENSSVLPVYPSVCKALDLSEKYDSIKYNFVHPTRECEQLDFAEYMERYIDYVQNVDSIENVYGTRVI